MKSLAERPISCTPDPGDPQFQELRLQQRPIFPRLGWFGIPARRTSSSERLEAVPLLSCVGIKSVGVPPRRALYKWHGC
jgi:hypothetical protein